MRVFRFWFLLAAALAAHGEDLEHRSSFLRIALAAEQPNFSQLAVDALGKSKLDRNLLLPLPAPAARYDVIRKGAAIEYHFRGSEGPAAWSFELSDRGVVIRTTYSKANPPDPLVVNFNPILCHATLLGLFNDEGGIRFPALLHLPDYGTLKITSAAEGVVLGYDAVRSGRENFVRVTFPPAISSQPKLEYRLEVTTVYPRDARIEADARYDGYRRNFLNILQLNPRYRVLANHAASDPCAFTVFLYSRMMINMPPLAEGLSALDILRQTLDRYTSGMRAYGMDFYRYIPGQKHDYLDTYPSLVMAASDYVLTSKDKPWLERNYVAIRNWAAKMIEFDRDGDGLLEYVESGNSRAPSTSGSARPGNWWDTIGFGHKDAYANALAYQAFRRMSEVARMGGHPADARLYARRARAIRSLYYKTFYNPATGVLAGWKSADGKLHDYHFLFVNGVAVTYDLLTPEQGGRIWDKLLAKMNDVGYTRFEFGLPGNLTPVRREDYLHLEKRWGGPDKEDGSDGFQIYENGGATACYAYFTIHALQKLGRNREAGAILYPMLQAFEAGAFQGRGPNGMTYDWKDWNGAPNGYEGLLVDGYLTLLAAMPMPSAHD
ncbi:MAG: hypothetical protein NTY38_26185 [Acidobacteria bacterium]|nr:hypothetical protein [Acidobacteriota bacterium]